MDISSLSGMWYANVFSHLFACFISFSLTISSEEQKFIFMKSNLLIFSYMDHAFVVILKNSLPNLRSHRSSRFSSKSFKVLHFTFRSIICFELIFVEGLRYWLGLFFWHVNVELFHPSFVEKIIFFPFHWVLPLFDLIWIVSLGMHFFDMVSFVEHGFVRFIHGLSYCV